MRMGFRRCMWRLPAEPIQEHSRWEIRVPPARVGNHLSWGEESHHGAAGEDAKAPTLCGRRAATPLAEQQPHCWAKDQLQDPEEQLVSRAFAVCRVSRSSEQGGAPAHVRQPGAVGADEQPLWPLSAIRVSSHATPQVCPQLPVTPTEQNQLCRLQGLIHPGASQYIHPSMLSTFLTGLFRTWLARYPLLLRLAESSLLLLLVSTTSTPACSCAKGPQEPIWHPTIPQAAAAILQHAKLNYGCVIFEHHSLYCENAKQHLFLGSTFMIMIWGATVPLRMKIIFLFFEENNYFQGEGVSALVCCLNHPAINTWSLEQKSYQAECKEKI